MSTTLDQIKKEMGGYQGQLRDVRIELGFPGKKPFYFYTGRVSIKSSQAEIEAVVVQMFADCFPDGYPIPEVLKFEFGRLEWIVDL